LGGQTDKDPNLGSIATQRTRRGLRIQPRARQPARAPAALNVWRKPPPQVLKRKCDGRMARRTPWRWFGYGSFVLMDGAMGSTGQRDTGRRKKDQRPRWRVSDFNARNGKMRTKQFLRRLDKWAKMPTAAQPTYGFMNWLSTPTKKLYQSACHSLHSRQRHKMTICDSNATLSIVAR